MMLLDRDRSHFCATYAAVSDAYVARWRVEADACNTMIA